MEFGGCQSRVWGGQGDRDTGKAAPCTGDRPRAASAQGNLAGLFLLCSPTDRLSCCFSPWETPAQMCCRWGRSGLALEKTAQLCFSSPVSRGIPAQGWSCCSSGPGEGVPCLLWGWEGGPEVWAPSRNHPKGS